MEIANQQAYDDTMTYRNCYFFNMMTWWLIGIVLFFLMNKWDTELKANSTYSNLMTEFKYWKVNTKINTKDKW